MVGVVNKSEIVLAESTDPGLDQIDRRPAETDMQGIILAAFFVFETTAARAEIVSTCFHIIPEFESLLLESRIEGIANAFTEKVVSQYGQQDGQAGKNR